MTAPRAIPRGETRDQPGAWWPLLLPDGRHSASVRCPVCGQRAYLDGHVIDAVGAVTPSARCPWDGCDFHAMIRLDGWAAFTAAGRA